MDDTKAILEILDWWDIYKKYRTQVNDPYRFRGRDDPKYPEIQKEYQQAVWSQDGALETLVEKINTYIDNRIEAKND